MSSYDLLSLQRKEYRWCNKDYVIMCSDTLEWRVIVHWCYIDHISRWSDVWSLMCTAGFLIVCANNFFLVGSKHIHQINKREWVKKNFYLKRDNIHRWHWVVWAVLWYEGYRFCGHLLPKFGRGGLGGLTSLYSSLIPRAKSSPTTDSFQYETYILKVIQRWGLRMNL